MTELSEIMEQKSTLAWVLRAYAEDAEDWRRPHLGASQIGKACTRALWYSFRWARPPRHIVEHDGRIMRLFNRGQREEVEFVRDLRRIGVEVHTVDPSTGNQFQVVALSGHSGGSMDGVALGIPEAPKTWHVLEFKTHGSKSFATLKKAVEDAMKKGEQPELGLLAAKPEHFTQVQLYMHWAKPKMRRALYCAVNKDTDELLFVRVHYDLDYASAMEQRAHDVITAAEPPPRIAKDATRFPCSFCDYRQPCHTGVGLETNCRTCTHSTPEMDGNARWSCALKGVGLDVEAQRRGCSGHRLLPPRVVFADLVEGNQSENWVQYRLPDGSHFTNGDPKNGRYASAEITAPGFAKLHKDETVHAMRVKFEARHVSPEELPREDERAVVTSRHGVQAPHPTAAGKDWGWQTVKKKAAEVTP